jgi:hypothetical protein
MDYNNSHHQNDDQQDNCIGSETESEIFRMIDNNEDLLTSLCPNTEQHSIPATIADLPSAPAAAAATDNSANGESNEEGGLINERRKIKSNSLTLCSLMIDPSLCQSWSRFCNARVHQSASAISSHY